MNLPANLIHDVWSWIAWAIWLPACCLAIVKAPWRRLAESEQLNVWLGMIVLLSVIWRLKAGVQPGLNLHLLGVTVFMLTFGPALSFVGLSLALAVVTLSDSTGSGELTFAMYSVNALLMVMLPVALNAGLHHWADRYLPRHFFVFIFGRAFFVAALTLVWVGLGVTLILGLDGAYSFEFLFAEYFPYFLLVGFSEAWLSGMLMTVFILYRPQWVPGFDDSVYLKGK